MRTEQEPLVTVESVGHRSKSERYDHPAYGTVTLSTVSGADKTLFGSDLKHGQRICIRVNRASLVRDLSHDWIHGRDQLVEFEMSHSQFAQFITSNGNGSGTPVTLTWVSGTGDAPMIKNIETKHETFRREIHTSAKSSVDGMATVARRLTEVAKLGKVGAKELRDIALNLERAVANLPSNMEFVVKSAEEALEKAAADAKIEVESYVAMTAQRIGLERISDLGLITGAADATPAVTECSHCYSKSMDQPYPRHCLVCGEIEVQGV